MVRSKRWEKDKDRKTHKVYESEEAASACSGETRVGEDVSCFKMAFFQVVFLV